jgi:DNA repair protein SbcD/Mre11
MKFIHTADFHLGRQFGGISLEEDFEAVLSQILTAVVDKRADALVIAGDIFDRASPPQTAIQQFNSFLSKLISETKTIVVLIAGNHDSGDRINSMSVVADRKRLLIRGVASPNEEPLLLHDKDGVIAFSALPFCYEYAAQEYFGDTTLATPEDVLKAQTAATRKNVPDGSRWVVVAHAFVTGASVSEGERSLTRAGGIETVNAEIFGGAHYVALGHLHRPQAVGKDHVRYSGSPLAFGFDEAEQPKSMLLVELDGKGSASVESIPFKPLRGVRVIKGKHAELVLAEPTQDFVKAVLTDEVPVIDAMKRLREVFPNACELTYARDERAAANLAQSQSAAKAATPMEVIGSFLSLVGSDANIDGETAVAAATIRHIQTGDAAQ